jgi:hypothetical protein
MTRCWLVFALVEDEDGSQSASWDGEFECMTELMLVAVCDDPTIAGAISDSIRALRVWVEERVVNTLFGRISSDN